MTRIAELVRGYLDYKHSLGYKVRTEGRTLMRFAEDMEEKGVRRPLTSEVALEWIDGFENAGP